MKFFFKKLGLEVQLLQGSIAAFKFWVDSKRF